jgi:ATP-binding protein involved in chromosome partitioning
MNTTSFTPKSIKAANGQLTILWNDGHTSEYTGRGLRLACRCAACIDENSQESLIRPEQIPPVVNAEKIEVVGNYALHFRWSDRHDTGIHTYDYLRQLCGCAECQKR